MRRSPDGEELFLASRSLGAGVVGLSLFASNISSTTLIGLPGAAYYAEGVAELKPGMDAYRAYLAAQLRFAGIPEAKASEQADDWSGGTRIGSTGGDSGCTSPPTRWINAIASVAAASRWTPRMPRTRFTTRSRIPRNCTSRARPPSPASRR